MQTSKITNKVREFLRIKLGIEAGYAKYFPRITDRKIYDFYLPNKEVAVIFDIGANIGQTALRFREGFPDATIYSFEPFEENLRALKKNTLGDEKIIVSQLALSNHDIIQEIYRDNNAFSEWNSLVSSRQEELQKSGSAKKEKISLTRGDTFCKQNRLDSIDILKTDTEGHDLEVLSGFHSLLENQKISCIVVEVGFLKDSSHSDFQKINSLLNSYNMLLAGFYESCHFESGKCEFSNALYVAPLPRPS